jgi:hypothetical protein
MCQELTSAFVRWNRASVAGKGPGSNLLYLEHIAVEKVARVGNGVPADAMSIDRTL